MATAMELLDPSSPILNNVAETVADNEVPTPAVQTVIDRMLEIAAGKGKGDSDRRQMVGLAAPQIGVAKRIILIDLAADGSHKVQDLRVIVNPVIARRSTALVAGREGCWSTAQICGNVQRADEVALEGLDRMGEPVSYVFHGFTARIAQHEVDHLDGIRFPDRVDDDDHLHWVEPAEFSAYRNEWPHWARRCSRGVWAAVKAGKFTPAAIDIHKAGGVIVRDRKLLLERSVGKSLFINPGGKIEAGETTKQALVRELKEELRIIVDEADLTDIGVFYAPAAGQEHKSLRMDLFNVERWQGEPSADSEVEELRWVASTLEPGVKTGSIFEKEVIPWLKAKNLIN